MRSSPRKREAQPKPSRDSYEIILSFPRRETILLTKQLNDLKISKQSDSWCRKCDVRRGIFSGFFHTQDAVIAWCHQVNGGFESDGSLKEV